MSETVEIEVSANLARFQQSMTKIRSAVGSLGTSVRTIDFSSTERSMEKLSVASRKSSKEGNTLAQAFREITNVKISNRTIRDMKEVFQEIVNVVKNLAPVINLAMNAVQAPLGRAVMGFTKLLTKVERLGSNFLILNKVFPFDLFNKLIVDFTRVTTSIQGMSKDLFNFGKTSVSAVRFAVAGFEKLVSGAKSADNVIEKILTRMQADGPKKFADNIKKTGSAFRASVTSAKQFHDNLKNINGTSNKARAVFDALKNKLNNVSAESFTAKANFRTLGQSLLLVVRSTGGIILGLGKLANKLGVTKGAIGATAVGLRVFQGATRIALRSVTSLSSKLANSGFKTFSNSVKLAVRPLQQVGNGIRQIATKPISTASSAFAGLMATARRLPIILGSIVGTFALVGRTIEDVATGSVSNFNRQFKRAMAELPASGQQGTGQVKEQMLELQKEMGITAEQALPALQQAFRKGFDADNAVGAVKQAMLLAKTEATDLEGAIDILGNSMRAFANEGLTASESADKLFRATRGVDVTMSSLSQSIKRLGPDIASTGVGFEGFLGALKTLTQQGKLGSTAISDIKSLLSALVAPANSAQDAMDNLGINFTRADLAGRGLGSILEEVRTATGGTASAMAEVLGGQENLNTALALGAQNGRLLADNMIEVANSTGQVQAQADSMDSAFARALRKMKANFEALKVELGSLMKPAVQSIIDFGADAGKKIKDIVSIFVKLFQAGDIGEVIAKSFAIGAIKISMSASKLGVGIAVGLASAITEGFQVIPQTFTGIVQNVLARFGDIGFAGIDLAGQLVSAFAKPIAFLKSGLIKAIEEAGDAINKLPLIGDGGASKARDFDVIFEAETKAIQDVGQALINVGNKGRQSAQAIIASTQSDMDELKTRVANAFSEGLERGQGSIADPPILNKLREDVSSILADVMNVQTKVNQGNKDAILGVGGIAQKLIGAEGDSSSSGFANMGTVIASSLANIAGGGGVAGTQDRSLNNILDVNKLQLQELVMSNRFLKDFEQGVVR